MQCLNNCSDFAERARADSMSELGHYAEQERRRNYTAGPTDDPRVNALAVLNY